MDFSVSEEQTLLEVRIERHIQRKQVILDLQSKATMLPERGHRLSHTRVGDVEQRVNRTH
jgi:hypothetical protein